VLRFSIYIVSQKLRQLVHYEEKRDVNDYCFFTLMHSVNSLFLTAKYNVCILHGSVATVVRWGAQNYSHLCQVFS